MHDECQNTDAANSHRSCLPSLEEVVRQMHAASLSSSSSSLTDEAAVAALRSSLASIFPCCCTRKSTKDEVGVDIEDDHHTKAQPSTETSSSTITTTTTTTTSSLHAVEYRKKMRMISCFGSDIVAKGPRRPQDSSTRDWTRGDDDAHHHHHHHQRQRPSLRPATQVVKQEEAQAPSWEACVGFFMDALQHYVEACASADQPSHANHDEDATTATCCGARWLHCAMRLADVVAEFFVAPTTSAGCHTSPTHEGTNLYAILLQRVAHNISKRTRDGSSIKDAAMRCWWMYFFTQLLTQQPQMVYAQDCATMALQHAIAIATTLAVQHHRTADAALAASSKMEDDDDDGNDDDDDATTPPPTSSARRDGDVLRTPQQSGRAELSGSDVSPMSKTEMNLAIFTTPTRHLTSSRVATRQHVDAYMREVFFSPNNLRSSARRGLLSQRTRAAMLAATPHAADTSPSAHRMRSGGRGAPPSSSTPCGNKNKESSAPQHHHGYNNMSLNAAPEKALQFAVKLGTLFAAQDVGAHLQGKKGGDDDVVVGDDDDEAQSSQALMMASSCTSVRHTRTTFCECVRDSIRIASAQVEMKMLAQMALDECVLLLALDVLCDVLYHYGKDAPNDNDDDVRRDGGGKRLDWMPLAGSLLALRRELMKVVSAAPTCGDGKTLRTSVREVMEEMDRRICVCSGIDASTIIITHNQRAEALVAAVSAWRQPFVLLVRSLRMCCRRQRRGAESEKFDVLLRSGTWQLAALTSFVGLMHSSSSTLCGGDHDAWEVKVMVVALASVVVPAAHFISELLSVAESATDVTTMDQRGSSRIMAHLNNNNNNNMTPHQRSPQRMMKMGEVHHQHLHHAVSYYVQLVGMLWEMALMLPDIPPEAVYLMFDVMPMEDNAQQPLSARRTLTTKRPSPRKLGKLLPTYMKNILHQVANQEEQRPSSSSSSSPTTTFCWPQDPLPLRTHAQHLLSHSQRVLAFSLGGEEASTQLYGFLHVAETTTAINNTRWPTSSSSSATSPSLHQRRGLPLRRTPMMMSVADVFVDTADGPCTRLLALSPAPPSASHTCSAQMMMMLLRVLQLSCSIVSPSQRTRLLRSLDGDRCAEKNTQQQQQQQQRHPQVERVCAHLAKMKSVMRGDGAATYARLVFLRVVQLLSQNKWRTTTKDEDDEAPSYSTEVLRTLRVLCWSFRDAHRTALKLSAPTVLARVLEMNVSAMPATRSSNAPSPPTISAADGAAPAALEEEGRSHDDAQHDDDYHHDDVVADVAAPPFIPKLSLGGLGPPLYFISSGDTAAAQEALLVRPPSCAQQHVPPHPTTTTTTPSSSSVLAMNVPTLDFSRNTSEADSCKQQQQQSGVSEVRASPTTRTLMPTSMMMELVLMLCSVLLQREHGGLLYAYTSVLDARAAKEMQRRRRQTTTTTTSIISTQQQQQQQQPLQRSSSSTTTHARERLLLRQLMEDSLLPVGLTNHSVGHVLGVLRTTLASSSAAHLISSLRQWTQEHFSAAEDVWLRGTPTNNNYDSWCVMMEECASPLARGLFVLLTLLMPNASALTHLRVRQRLGCGGFGSVFAATSSSSSSSLALKLVPVERHGEDVAGMLPMIHAEVMTMLRMRHHPHIVQLIDFGCTGAEYFLISPQYGQSSVRGWRTQTHKLGVAALMMKVKVRRDELICVAQNTTSTGGIHCEDDEDDDDVRGTLMDVCLSIFGQVLEALVALHDANIRHGDLKADNLLMDCASTAGARGDVVHVRVCDFGSSDACSSADMRDLLHDVDGGEGRFLAGRWSCARGTEAVQPPEMMQPRRQYMMVRHAAVEAVKMCVEEKNNSTNNNNTMRPHAVMKLLNVLRKMELSVDVWSCGCLLYELLTGRMLFGDDQLGRLLTLGASSSSSSSSCAVLRDEQRQELLSVVDARVVKYMDELLSLDPLKRPTAEEALAMWRKILAS